MERSEIREQRSRIALRFMRATERLRMPALPYDRLDGKPFGAYERRYPVVI
jgi:hypothetical protein